MINYEQLRAAVDTKLSMDPEFRTIMKRINSGRATFIDTARYSQVLSHILGSEVSKMILNVDDREAVVSHLLHDSYEDINDVFGRVQSDIDKKKGLNIKPRQGEYPGERVEQFVHSLVDPTVENSVIERRARAGTETITKSFHDDCIEENAKLHEEAGLKTYIIRMGTNCCPWCSEVAGKYEMKDQPQGIFRRHDNCDCTVIYDGQVLRGQAGNNGKRSKKWVEVPKNAGAVAAPRLSQEQAKQLNDSKVKINKSSIDNSSEIDIIELEKDYATAGLMFISHRDNLYKYAIKVPAIEGFEDVTFHADRNSFMVLNPLTSDLEKRLSPKQVARLIKNSNNYNNTNIRLLSCQSGYGGEESLAQQLADELGVTIQAPTEILAIDNTGKTFISDNQYLIDMWSAGEHVQETGEWKTFEPRR